MRSVLVVVPLVLVGCDGGENRPDATVIIRPDAPIDAPKPCGAQPTYGMVTPMDEVASRDLDVNPTQIAYDAAIDTNPKFDDFSLQLFKGLGVFMTGEIGPTTLALTGDEANYETCGACALIYVDLDPEADYQDDGVYMVTSGTLNITAVTPNLKGTLNNAKFTHVNIDPDSYRSTPIGDCDSEITSLAFDFPVETSAPEFTSAKRHPRLRKPAR